MNKNKNTTNESLDKSFYNAMSQIIKEKQNERVSKDSSKIIEFVNNYDKMKLYL